MSADITLLTVFVAGILSFLSPCVLPLVPPYLTYLAGVSIDELGDDSSSMASASVRNRVMVNATAFVIGFSIVFVALGAGASSIGHFVRVYQTELGWIAGVIIILMGLHFLGVFKFALLYREAQT